MNRAPTLESFHNIGIVGTPLRKRWKKALLYLGLSLPSKQTNVVIQNIISFPLGREKFLITHHLNQESLGIKDVVVSLGTMPGSGPGKDIWSQNHLYWHLASRAISNFFHFHSLQLNRAARPIQPIQSWLIGANTSDTSVTRETWSTGWSTLQTKSFGQIHPSLQ